MKRNPGLRHLSLKTRDLDKTEKFYTDVLGLEVAFRHPPKRLFLRWPKQDDLLDFVKTRETLKKSSGLDHFGFSVTRARLNQLKKQLRKNKVKIEGQRGNRSVYFRDNNGYWVEFYCD